jgi:hypothetical protein
MLARMLARFERLMEHAVEGSLRRVFQTTLQPVQVAKAAARAMEEAQVVGLRGAEAPNAYRVRLAPADFGRFGEYRGTLAGELRQYLREYAAERGLRLVGEPRVEVVEDGSLRSGVVRVQARFVDAEPARQAALDAAVEGTRRLRLADLAAAGGTAAPDEPSAAPQPALWLEDRLGLRVPLEPEQGVVRIGRAVDNDAVIPNQRVSRYHAQLRRVSSTWLVYDLDSTNGTFIGDVRVEPGRPRPLPPDATLRVGDHELRVVRS